MTIKSSFWIALSVPAHKWARLALLGGAMTIFSFVGAKTAHALSLRNTSNNLGLVGYWSLNDGTLTKVYPVSVSNGATDFSGKGKFSIA